MWDDIGEVSEETLDQGMPRIPVNKDLGEPPDADEVARAIAEMKESQAGTDEVSISMIKWGGDKLLVEIVRLIRGMWRH
eukprot:5294802-Pyramimonas_sp.AAC.1